MLEKINYLFKRSAWSRVVRISVHQDGRVVATAPRWISKRFVEKFVESKAEWIREKLNFLKTEVPIQPKVGNRREYKKYKESARKLINQKLKQFNQFYNFDYNRVAIRFQKTRWGSCSKKGNLNFNYRVVFLPEPLLDYLVVHELCHLEEMNHGKKFWDLISQTIPDCKIKSKQLRNFR